MSASTHSRRCRGSGGIPVGCHQTSACESDVSHPTVSWSSPLGTRGAPRPPSSREHAALCASETRVQKPLQRQPHPQAPFGLGPARRYLAGLCLNRVGTLSGPIGLRERRRSDQKPIVCTPGRGRFEKSRPQRPPLSVSQNLGIYRHALAIA